MTSTATRPGWSSRTTTSPRFKTAIQISTGLAHGNYIHNPGYIAGDHTNGFFANGGTSR